MIYGSIQRMAAIMPLMMVIASSSSDQSSMTSESAPMASLIGSKGSGATVVSLGDERLVRVTMCRELPSKQVEACSETFMTRFKSITFRRINPKGKMPYYSINLNYANISTEEKAQKLKEMKQFRMDNHKEFQTNRNMFMKLEFLAGGMRIDNDDFLDCIPSKWRNELKNDDGEYKNDTIYEVRLGGSKTNVMNSPEDNQYVINYNDILDMKVGEKLSEDVTDADRNEEVQRMQQEAKRELYSPKATVAKLVWYCNEKALSTIEECPEEETSMEDPAEEEPKAVSSNPVMKALAHTVQKSMANTEEQPKTPMNEHTVLGKFRRITYKTSKKQPRVRYEKKIEDVTEKKPKDDLTLVDNKTETVRRVTFKAEPKAEEEAKEEKKEEKKPKKRRRRNINNAYKTRFRDLNKGGGFFITDHSIEHNAFQLWSQPVSAFDKKTHDVHAKKRAEWLRKNQHKKRKN